MALGLLAAVHKAQATGEGEFFDVAMYDGVLTLLKSNVAAFGLTGQIPKPGVRALVPFGLFNTSDGRIAIAAPVERHWADLCRAMGREELIDDERTKTNPRRVRNTDFTNAQVEAWTTTKTKQEIVDLIGGRVPVGPANTIEEVFNDPHTQARNMIDQVEYPGDNPAGALSGNPIKFLNTPTSFHQRPPTHGEHTDEVLREFGIQRE